VIILKAVFVEEPGVLKVKEVPKPEMGKDDILLKMRTASICNASDVRVLEGTRDPPHKYPHLLGHEAHGEVVAFGSNVKGYKIGERLVCVHGDGAFCEYITTKYGIHLPKEIPDEEGSLCEMFHGSLVETVHTAGIKEGEKVLVIGQGPMGLTAAQCARVYGAGVLIGIDTYSFRCEKAKELGADYVYNRSEMSSDDIVADIKNKVGSVDLVLMCIDVDVTQAKDAYKLAIDVLREGGRITGLSTYRKGNESIIDWRLFQKHIQFARFLNPNVYPYDITTREGYSASWDAMCKVWQNGVYWVRDGKVNMKKLITHHVSLDDVYQGLMLCKYKPNETIKVVVDISV